jgi:N-acyl-D-aspartate/D-glutamate deacylase
MSLFYMRIRLITFDSIGIGVNVIHLVGHGTVRSSVMGQEAREPTDEDSSLTRPFFLMYHP